MNACEYLARVGFEVLRPQPWHNRVDGDFPDDGTPLPSEFAEVRKRLLREKPKPYVGRQGVRWLGLISWPDRVPGLVTWSGQQSLDKAIVKLQKAIESVETTDLFELRSPIKGTTGLDSLSCQDAVDVGFSPHALGMEVVQRPALELLAIVGLESVPIISYGPRDCGFVHQGHMWRFPIETRDGGYYHRWGEVKRVSEVML